MKDIGEYRYQQYMNTVHTSKNNLDLFVFSPLLSVSNILSVQYKRDCPPQAVYIIDIFVNLRWNGVISEQYSCVVIVTSCHGKRSYKYVRNAKVYIFVNFDSDIFHSKCIFRLISSTSLDI